MEEKKAEILQKFRKFIDSIGEDDVVAVMHHTDPDGICSAVIMAKLVERKRGKRAEFRISQGSNEIAILDSTVKELERRGATKVIITDLGVDQSPEKIKKIEKFAEIAVIDHHKIYNDLSSERTLFIKPQLMTEKKPSAYPTAKLCFDLASGIEDMIDVDWVAAIGVIGDCAFESWRGFLEEVFKKYKIKIVSDFFKTKIGEAASLISDAECVDSALNAEKSFEILYRSGSVDDVLNSELREFSDEVEKELSKWMKDSAKLAESHEGSGLIFYQIKPKYNIKSQLSTRMSFSYPHNTIVIAQDMGERMVHISARRRDERVAVNDLLEKAVEGLEGSNAGGHIPAAGAGIRREDFGKFKENLLKALKNG